MNRIRKFRNKLTKTQNIAISFLGIIVLGSLLLMLPMATKEGQSTDYLTALFTATSSTCVTGLVVADTYTHWSIFGQIVILCMIQIGGLGVITMGILVAVIFKRTITLRTRNLLQESINSLQIGGVVRLVRKAIFGTALIEVLGAVALLFYFVPELGWGRGIYYSIFHSISAFCNAGFDLMGFRGQYGSFVSAIDKPILNITIMLLITLGGLGFVVWDDLTRKTWHVKKYQFHTKLVLSVSAILIFGGGLLFYLFERNGLLADVGIGGKILGALFSSVTARTAGFNTIDTGALSDGSKLLTMILMFIGGSPGSTAGGVKTTTFAVILIYSATFLKGKKGANIFGRCISDDTVKKAITVFMLNLTLAMIAAILICGLQSLDLRDVLFEVFSAIGTVGMSTGITRDLSTVSRIMIMVLMYLGRIGSMTFALAFSEGRRTPKVQLPQIDEAVG